MISIAKPLKAKIARKPKPIPSRAYPMNIKVFKKAVIFLQKVIKVFIKYSAKPSNVVNTWSCPSAFPFADKLIRNV